MKRMSYVLSAIRSPRKIFQSLTYMINDDVYWDSYVRDWRKSDLSKSLPYLGNEWKNEEVFVSLLKKYSSLDSNCLEIGCGGGRITSEASHLFKMVYATDVSNEMLRQCRRSMKNSNIVYNKLDGFTLCNFRSSYFNFVFSHDVFVHFSSLQVYPYLEEIKRVLQSGGISIISFYNIIHHFGLFKEMSLKFRDQKRFPPHMGVHFLTEEIIPIMLLDLNFEILEIDLSNYLIVVFRKKPDSA